MLVIQNNKVTVHIPSKQKTYKAEIFHDSRGWFLSTVSVSIEGSHSFMAGSMDNDAILREFGFNKEAQKKLYEEVLGYWNLDTLFQGWWPWCRTRKDLITILNVVANPMHDPNFIDISYMV